MLSGKKWNQTSLRWWLGSYSVIIALSIVINLLGYFVAARTVEAEIEKTNTLMLNNIKSIYDMYFSGIEDTSYQVLRSAPVKRLEGNRELKIDVKTELIQNIQDRLGHLLTDNIISEALVVIKNRNMCIDSLNMYNLQNAYSINFENVYQSYDAWLNDLSDVQVGEYRFLRKNDGSIGMYLIRTLAELHKQADSFIIVEFNLKSIETMLGNSLSDNAGSFYMTTAEGDIIFGTDEIFSTIRMDGSHALMSVNKRNYVVSSVESKIKGVNYVYSVSNEVYRRKMNFMILAFCLSYLLCILFGGLLAWIFSKKNYSNALAAERKIKERNIKLSANILSQILLKKD